ncbi:MAG: hypothetical protein JST68_30810 [Bacteroidetes bacterium]|nr:hypothetical protein [Bacteroidota bacterium]
MQPVIAKIILYTSVGVPLLPLFLSVKNFKQYTPRFRVLCFLLLNAAACGIAASILNTFHIANLALLHVYTVVELLLIGCYYQDALKEVLPKALIPVTIAVFVIASLCNSFFIQGWNHFNTYTRPVEAVIVIAWSIIYYYKVLSGIASGLIRASPDFWINTGFLLYFSAALSLFTLSNYILPLDHRFNIYIWTLHACFSNLLYIFIFVGLWNYKVE